MSGHSKWSTIKHRKGARDAKRGQLFTKLIKEITVSARVGGGDPSANSRLRGAIDAAKAANMPNENITRAIAKGTGALEGVQYEELVYEGVGPAGTLFLCEVMTDNRNRTAAEVRKVFDKNQGQLGSSGLAAWAFEQKGVIQIAKDGASEERLLEVAVGAGAEDFELVGESWVVKTPRSGFDAVRSAFDEAGIVMENASLAYIAHNAKVVGGNVGEQLVRLFEALDEHDDVQNVYADFELSDEDLANLG